MIHAAFTIVAAILTGLLLGDWTLGALVFAAFYVGREHAQAEYRWVECYGLGRRANLPWWGAFDRRVWDAHSLTGWIIPALLFLAIYAFGYL